ncbi:hypothetical protein RJ641_005686 [Dillenia turbinata]|uniref:Clp R domain-containing protein n=1 Tax=Dillenia turbinata TaxID=194707 RepID=A0AAN8VGG8_9MAGN
MPTPVTTARQCLTEESAHALNEAVSVARRRNHLQTTSIHAISALLSLSSFPILRDACSRARNSVYSPRLQNRALELCLNVSLDRLPSNQNQQKTNVEEPPISNSLMAAIKRSQANQRRQPENFHLYHQQQQQQHQNSSICSVKVELQNFILSILDDPIVSRVFGEAGFRSSDIKLAILRPLPQLLRFSSTSKRPPLFLCNLGENYDLGRSNFRFPFMGFSGFCEIDENCRRICEILVKNRGRNPLLVGFHASSCLESFSETIEQKKDSILPVELRGLSAVSIEDELSRPDLRFEEINEMIEKCLGPGLVVNFGDLKVFDDVVSETASYVVEKLTWLLRVHGERVWLMGSCVSCEMYLKFLKRFPSIEKDWDLQLLPITSLKPSIRESYPKSTLMESFVPFGGFFSSPSDVNLPLSRSHKCLPRCQTCNEKCEKELIAVSNGESIASVADQCENSLPSWMQINQIESDKGSDILKAKDAGMALSVKVMGLQRKWDNICQHLHQSQGRHQTNEYLVSSQLPAFMGIHALDERSQNNNDWRNNTIPSPNGSQSLNVHSCMSKDLPKTSMPELCGPFPVVSESKSEKVIAVISENLQNTGSATATCNIANSSVRNALKSSLSATSVTTDLGLGIFSTANQESNGLVNQMQTRIDLLQDLSGRFSANVDTHKGSVLNHTPQSSSGSCSDFLGQFDSGNFKTISSALVEKIGRQDEAISLISKTIARCRTGNEKRHGKCLKGDIWFNFLGPDKIAQKRIAVALAEILYGSRENFLSVDLSSEIPVFPTNIGLYQEDLNCDVKFRGKTIVDYVAGELRKRPLSVVHLENIDKADLLAQNSLSRAIRTGKFSDSHGREVGINSAIFILTSNIPIVGRNLSSMTGSVKSCEERLLCAKGQMIQILTSVLEKRTLGHDSGVCVTDDKDSASPNFMNKRKLFGIHETAKRLHKASNIQLDLNLPAEETEVNERPSIDGENSNFDLVADNSSTWLEGFFGQVDETVYFKPFDYDALIDKILKEIKMIFHKTVGSECSLEIDSRVMEQIAAAACWSDGNRVEDWVEKVLGGGFTEVQKRYDLTAQCSLKLVVCDDALVGMEKQALGVCLPLNIIVK